MQSREIHRMGTIIQLSVQHEYASFVLDELILRMKEYEKWFSAHDPSSELMKVNNNAGMNPVKVNRHLFELIRLGKEHSLASGSSLNIAVGPLVQAWKIGFKDANIPSPKKIQSLLTKTNANDILLNEIDQTIFLKQPGMFIDLGALAKGYMADLLIEDLESMQVSAGLINLGGNVITYGKSPKHSDGYWRIGVQHPLLPRGNSIAVLRSVNQSVVTSGIYERTYTVNNETYHHILDPSTGYPIESDIAGLTVISKLSVDGEIWTGRLFGQSPHQIIYTLNEIEDVEGIVVTKDSQMFYTDALKTIIKEGIL